MIKYCVTESQLEISAFMERRSGMNKFMKSSLSILLVVVIVFLLSPEVFAQPKEEKRVVKVGVLDFKGFSGKNKDGKYEGYGIEYLNKIKKYNSNWTYKYVEGNWEDLMKMLRNQEIDLVCTAKYSEDRDGPYNSATGKGGYDYSEQSIGQVQGTLYTLKDNQLYYNDYERLMATKIGFLKKSLNIDMFEKFIQTYYDANYKILDKENDSKYIKFYENENALTKALKSGEIDALATEHMAYHDDLRLIAKYGSEPFFSCPIMVMILCPGLMWH